MYTVALDEVKARADLLDKESLQRLLVGLLGYRVFSWISSAQDSQLGLLHPKILFWGLNSIAWFLLH